MSGRYVVDCATCGLIVADTDDGLYSLQTAHRRAGFHEGVHETPEHSCEVRGSFESSSTPSGSEPIRVRSDGSEVTR